MGVQLYGRKMNKNISITWEWKHERNKLIRECTISTWMYYTCINVPSLHECTTPALMCYTPHLNMSRQKEQQTNNKLQKEFTIPFVLALPNLFSHVTLMFIFIFCNGFEFTNKLQGTNRFHESVGPPSLDGCSIS